MKLKDFIEMLQAAGLPGDAEVKIFDADMREMMPVTGMVHNADEVQLHSEDMNM